MEGTSLSITPTLTESAEEVCDFEGERGLEVPGGSLQVSRACVGGLVLLETQCKQERRLARGHQGASHCQ